MSVNKPVVAIVGRPNVGKSTLFNRIIQKRRSIVHAASGVTRDRVYEAVDWAGHEFVLIDTGGYVPDSRDQMEAAIRTQVKLAIEEADQLLFVVDARDMLTSLDMEIAQLLRKSGKPVSLAVNKSDSQRYEAHHYDFYTLGLGDPLPISALNGLRIGDLLDVVVDHFPEQAAPGKSEQPGLNLAIVGMPNAGKSSLLNALIGREKAIVTDIPGTTRDSIDTTVKYYGETITLIDTAGLRKKSRIKNNVEFYSTVRANKAVERSDITLVVVDATQGFNRQDADIVRQVIERKKGLIVTVNKWDLIDKEAQPLHQYKNEIIYRLPALRWYPLLFISARTKQRVFEILKIAREVDQARRLRISTPRLNDYFQTVLQTTPPPSVKGKHIKIKFVNQVRVQPPVLLFFCNYPRLVPRDYRRFLENKLRAEFGFFGVPLTLKFREK